jgi:hypothetical protein
MHAILHNLKVEEEPGMVVHTCNLSTQEAEAGGSQVQDQPGLLGKILSKRKSQ